MIKKDSNTMDNFMRILMITKQQVEEKFLLFLITGFQTL